MADSQPPPSPRSPPGWAELVAPVRFELHVTAIGDPLQLLGDVQYERRGRAPELPTRDQPALLVADSLPPSPPLTRYSASPSW